MLNIAKNSRLDKCDTADKKIATALMASFVVLTIQYFILIFFNLIGTSTGSTVQLLSKLLVGGVYACALPVVLKRNTFAFLGVYFIALFIFLSHYLIFPENNKQMQSIFFDLFFMSMPAFIYSLSIRDFSIFRDIMKKAAIMVFVFGTLTAGAHFTGRASIGAYSMSLSYYMLLPTIIFLDKVIDKVTFRNLAVVIISLAVILSLGARGPVMCIAVFVFLKFIKPNDKITIKRAATYGLLFNALVLVLIFFKQIILALYNFFLNFGISSRTLLLFLRDDIRLSGRDIIIQNVMPKILDSPILGIGLTGDYRILDGSYAHNFFIEVLGNFGFIVGTIIIVSILLLIVRSLLIKDKEKYSLIIIWLSLGFVPLMVSGSYLTNINFWILLGFALRTTFAPKNAAKKGLRDAKTQKETCP